MNPQVRKTSKDVKFVILSSQRSGSTWLIDVLNNLDNTKAYGELFLNEKRVWDVGALDYPRYVEAKSYSVPRPFSVFSYLTDLYRQPGSIGFKLMYSHLLKNPEIFIYLSIKRTTIIHLIRQNHLDVIISREMKKLGGPAHRLKNNDQIVNIGRKAKSTQAPSDQTKGMIRLEPDLLLKTLKSKRTKVNAFRKLLRSLKFDNHEVLYEELVRDTSNFDTIFGVLDASSSDVPKSSIEKIIKKQHSDFIKNYHEVKKSLSNTEFADLIK